MKLINLTSKEIPIWNNGILLRVLPSCNPGKIPSQIVGDTVTTQKIDIDDGYNITICHTSHRTLYLPKPKKKTRYIVDHHVLLANPKRWDLLSVKEDQFPTMETTFIKLHL